jgi:hypothetical protein
VLDRTSTPSLPCSAVVAVTTEPTGRDHNPLDYDQWICEPETVGYEELPLLAEVHRMVGKAVALAGGSVPPVGSTAWWSAGPVSRIAGLLVLAEARLVDDPDALVAEQLKAVSVAISGALDWSANAYRLIFEAPGQIALRRAVAATPIRCAHRGCLVVVSVEHPLPDDWSVVQCFRHGKQDTA